ncbi:MAG TPA: VWA domain-containing protein [Thermoanaerobaculia bacterium]|jgi:VWFA-related protein|nr:VWA domain-containing protein [Thermoanaerobaculia bacterium]
MNKPALFLGLLVAAMPVFAAAQQYTETVQVTIVEVPVTVVDRSGNPVNGLTKNDFEVTDDGRKAKIVGLDSIDMSKVAVYDNATPLPPAAYRNFLLLFDLANSSPGTIGRAQTAAKDFVKSQIGRRDLAAVATFTVDRGLQVVTSFTSDKDLLDHAITTLGHPTYYKVEDPLRIAFTTMKGFMEVEKHGIRESVDVPIAELLQWTKMTDKVRDLEATRRLRRQFDSLADVARVLDPLRGQKQVVLLSEGFDPRLVQGREDLSTFAVESASHSTPTDTGDDSNFGSAALMTDLEKMAQAFRRSGVTLHAIDVKGLRTNVDASEGSKKTNTGDSLYFMVRPTGGTVFKNASDLTENFARLLKQQETVYLLAIESKLEKPGKVHTLKVKVPSMKGAKITHRAAYYEALPKVSPLEQTLSLADIMMTDADVKDVPLAMTAMPLPSKSGGARLPIVLEIPGEGLLKNVTGNSVTANLFVYAFDEQFQIKDFLQQRISLDLTKSGTALRGAGLRYVGMLTLPPGKYAVKALARVEETGRVGFLRTDIDVPATNGPAILPPVFVSDRPGWINVAAPESGASAVAVFTAAGKAFVPARKASLKNDGAYRVALFVHDTPAEGLDISPMVVSADGSSQFAPMALVGRTAADSEGSAKVLLEFKPVNFAAGDYKLQFTVKPKDGQPSVVDVPFRIE